MRKSPRPPTPLSRGGPKVFVPRKSSLHRQAAIALYRALISQCRASPFPPTDRTSLQHMVRNRFIANRDIVSPRILKLHFLAAYRALDHLDGAAADDKQSIAHLKSFLGQAPLELKSPQPPPPPPRTSPPGHAEPPPEHKFFANWPRPTVTGIRRAPCFVHATGFAFVRYKKPQPYSLSRTLRQLIEQKHKRQDRKDDLEYYHIPLAEHEDAWENIVEKDLGVLREPGTFRQTVMECQVELWSQIKTRYKLNLRMAKAMMDVVTKEEQLALEERDERRRIAWEKRQAKKKILNPSVVHRVAVSSEDETSENSIAG